MKRLALYVVMGFMLLGMALLTTRGADLNPSSDAFDGAGNPVANMKSLDEVEPRKPIMTLPTVVTNPGSYYLIQNMIATSNIVGIRIECSDVHIDLKGLHSSEPPAVWTVYALSEATRT